MPPLLGNVTHALYMFLILQPLISFGPAINGRMWAQWVRMNTDGGVSLAGYSQLQM